MTAGMTERRIIDQRYQILSTLGEGSSGTTYLAKDLQNQTQVALKALSIRSMQDWKMLELFEREITILKGLDHAAIPRYLDSFIIDTPTDRHFYLVQALAKGKTLQNWIDIGWRCTEADVLDIAKQLLNILIYLQSLTPPVIHRDLKPQNIIRRRTGEIALVDFGAVGHTYHNTFMRGSTVVGTFGYMAPEQFRAQACPATDLYSLGATLLFLLTRRSPADLPVNKLTIDFQDHINVSPAFARWLAVMLQPGLDKRFKSARSAQQALKYRSIRSVQIKTPKYIQLVWLLSLLLCVSVTGLSHRYRYRIINFLAGGQSQSLARAIIDGDLSMNAYLSKGGSNNIDDAQAPALFSVALLQGQYELVNNMAEQGLDIEPLIRPELSLLHILVREDNFNAITHLHTLYPQLNLNSKDALGTPLLHIASSEESALKLIEMGATTQAQDADGQSFLELTINKEWHTAKEVSLNEIENNADAIRPLASSGHSLILLAIQRNDYDLALRLRALGFQFAEGDISKLSIGSIPKQHLPDLIMAIPNLSEQDVYGTTLLDVAVNDLNEALVQDLLNLGVSPSLRNVRGVAPITRLERGVYERHDLELREKSRKILLQLVAAGLDLNDSVILHQGVIHADVNDIDFLRRLVAGGASINHRDRRQNTPLHYAFKEEFAKALIELGADVNAVNKDGVPPAFSHRYTMNTELEIGALRQILKAGENVDQKFRYGNTRLHGVPTLEMAQVLIDAGANPNVLNDDGLPPIFYARSIGIFHALKDAGADLSFTKGDNRIEQRFCKIDANYGCRNNPPEGEEHLYTEEFIIRRAGIIRILRS